jgi:hypothetical protein
MVFLRRALAQAQLCLGAGPVSAPPNNQEMGYQAWNNEIGVWPETGPVLRHQNLPFLLKRLLIEDHLLTPH